jgi:cyclopropane-fatty-acyl-phospholipid synthase
MFEKKIFNQILGNIKEGSLKVRYWDGETKMFGEKGGSTTIDIKDPKVINHMLSNMSLGFGEAYMNGLADTNNLTELMILAMKNSQLIKKHNLLSHLHKNTKSKQAKYIQHHYDIGNDFFKLWLDTSMTYSCAYFTSPKETLEQAQEQKRHYILKKLQLEKNMNLLDIGCGWGTLLIEAAKQFNVTGMGITLSKEQYKHAKEQAKKEGVADNITFSLINFQDLFNKKKKFDRIVSVGMFEHVGKENYSTYFRLIDELLVDGGISVLHTISKQTEEANDEWIDKYIFPGGYLPSIREIVSYFPNYNLRLLDYENLRIHYAMTLDEWTKRFLKHKKEIVNIYDEKFFRMWYFWLIGSATGFRFGDLDLSQFVLVKGINNTLPLTRERLYKNGNR